MSTIDEAELDRLEGLYDDGCHGDGWRVECCHENTGGRYSRGGCCSAPSIVTTTEQGKQLIAIQVVSNDAEFAAAVHNAFPALIAAARALPAEIRAREEAERERDALVAGLNAFVNCQSPLTRAQMREAAAGLLEENGHKPTLLADQSPFVARATAAEQRAEEAERVNAVWRQNSRETFEALCAMRNDINQHVPMPSLESDLLNGPDTSVFCAAVASSVIAALAAEQQRVKALEEALAKADAELDRLAAEGLPPLEDDND